MVCLSPPSPPSYLIMTLKPSSSHPLPRLLICSPGQTNFPPLHRYNNKNLSQPEMSLRDLSPVFNDRDISNTSQKHFKRDVFFVTSLRRLKCIQKKCLLCDASECICDCSKISHKNGFR